MQGGNATGALAQEWCTEEGHEWTGGEGIVVWRNKHALLVAKVAKSMIDKGRGK